MKLIVGLGNPGKNYDHTRHNMGFFYIDHYAKKHNVEINKEKFNGVYNEFIYNKEKIILLKPYSFINLSGEVIKKYVDFFKIDIQDILIICDDLDTPIGKYKLKSKGSSGGHNGLKNIEFMLQTQDYCRLKIGISNNKAIDTKDYVLSKLDDESQKIINENIDIICEIIDAFVSIDFQLLMNKYNRK